jgi:cysteine synthase
MSILAHIGNTPLVELKSISRGLPVPILGKCEHMNPGGSIKDRIALAIVEDAEARGALRAEARRQRARAAQAAAGVDAEAIVRHQSAQ